MEKIQIPSIFCRHGHCAVLEPISRQLWLIGGTDNLYNVTSDVLKFNLIKKTTLKDIAIQNVVQSICVNDPSLAAEELPRCLGNKIEEYRSEIPGANACTQRNKCMACLLAADPATQMDEYFDMQYSNFDHLIIFMAILLCCMLFPVRVDWPPCMFLAYYRL